MTLENKVLQKLAEAAPKGDRHELTVSAGAWTAHLIYDRRDELSGRLWEVALHRKGATDEAVQDRADRIAKRATGLLEALKVVEVDAVKQQALLRSATPTVKGDDLFFYEILLRGAANATIRRFHGSQQIGKKREQTAFALTHESLAKLVADVAAQK